MISIPLPCRSLSQSQGCACFPSTNSSNRAHYGITINNLISITSPSSIKYHCLCRLQCLEGPFPHPLRSSIKAAHFSLLQAPINLQGKAGKRQIHHPYTKYLFIHSQHRVCSSHSTKQFVPVPHPCCHVPPRELFLSPWQQIHFQREQ